MARSTHATMSVPKEVRDTCQRLSIELTGPAGRRVTLADVLAAALVLADAQRDRLLKELTKPKDDQK